MHSLTKYAKRASNTTPTTAILHLSITTIIMINIKTSA